MTQQSVSTSSALSQLTKCYPTNARSIDIIAREPNGGELLQSLQELQKAVQNGKALPEVNERFISDLIDHLARPAQTINQGKDITCSQTACMWYLARHEKAEFIRVCSGLALQGQATLKGGQTLTVARNGLKLETSAETGEFDPRTQVEKLFQTSLMQSNSSDFDIKGEDGKKTTIRGTTVQQTVNQVSQITGSPHIGVAERGDLDRVFNRISSLIRRRDLVALNKEFVGVQGVFQWAKSGKDVVHDAAIDHFEVDANGQIFVQVFHGWGKYKKDSDTPTIGRDEKTGLELLSFDEYKKRCLTLVLDQNQETSRLLSLHSSVDALSSDVILLVDPMIMSREELLMRVIQNRKQKDQLQEEERRERSKVKSVEKDNERTIAVSQALKRRSDALETPQSDSPIKAADKGRVRKSLADILLEKE